MPRKPKSAVGKIKICKALNLDGTRCNKEFICKRHRSSDHMHCSEKCRKRDHRLKAKKQRQKDEKVAKKLQKQQEYARTIFGKLQGAYEKGMSYLHRLDAMIIPFTQKPEKKSYDEEFRGPGSAGYNRYLEYESNRKRLIELESNRQIRLQAEGPLLINHIKEQMKLFREYSGSKELKVSATELENAKVEDMSYSIFGLYFRVGKKLPEGLSLP